MSKIKICGLFRPQDIDYVNKAKPDYAGFIIDFPKSHRSINLETAIDLISRLDKNIKSVCVFVNKPIEYIEKFAEICDVIQLHGDENNDYIDRLRAVLPNKEIWRAFKIRSKSDIEKSSLCSADLSLLDNGYGTGESFEWELISSFNKDFILAGGINCENIEEAIQKFKPFVIDVSSGVETGKFKDYQKMKIIVDKVRDL